MSDPEGSKPRTALVHYSAPPVVGGVEAVMYAQAASFLEAGYPAAVVSGRGDSHYLPEGTEFLPFLEMDTQHPKVVDLNRSLEAGDIPPEFDGLIQNLVESLGPILSEFDSLIVHNIFTKHFNLPLTAALFRLLDQGRLRNCIAWCHDLSWTSSSSRRRLQAGYPWDLLRTYHPGITYVTISQERRTELAGLLEIPPEQIHLIYNGVDPKVQLGLSDPGWELIQRLELLESDLNLLMPVRVTRAKNIELAIRTAAALKEHGLQVRVVLTGPPDPHDSQSMAYFHSLLELRARLGVEQEMRFIFESGPDPNEPYTIEAGVVGELYRVADLLFMPSLREGFGMPILEAGLAGIPIVSTGIPAAWEIAGSEAVIIDARADPEQVAGLLFKLSEDSPTCRLRRRVRQEFSWGAIFQRQIEPLLRKGSQA
jgi:mannosylglucosylglycerate synthase